MLKQTNRIFIVIFVLFFIGSVIPAASWVSTELPAEEGEQDSIDETMAKLEALYRYIDSTFIFDIDADAVFDSMAKGLFSALDDPYSEYITAEESRDLQDLTQGVYGGIGAYISKPNPSYIDYEDPETYMVTIVAPFLGSPAYKSGLHAGDLISEIDGIPVDEYTAQEAAANLRGTPGTIVTLLIHRGSSTFTIEVERAIVEVPTVQYDMIGTTGYLRIIEFNPLTPEKTEEALTHFKENGYDSIILDLRSNPGGVMEPAIQVADFFLSSKTALLMESGPDKESSQYRTRSGREIPLDIPLVILTNGGTASSSEILAGALRDNDRAVIMGETSFGKGLVQSVYPFDDGDYFKITSARYMTPDGHDIHEIGIVPDIEVVEPVLTDEEMDLFVQLQDEKLIEEFVAGHESFTDAEVDPFVASLQESGYSLESRFLRKLIRNEFENSMDFPPVFDLEYDIVLTRAIEYVQETLSAR